MTAVNFTCFDITSPATGTALLTTLFANNPDKVIFGMAANTLYVYTVKNG